MSGIDRLRTLAGAWDEWGLGGTLAEMADQIERERAEDCYRMGLDCGTVWRVVADMERHCLGHEGMDDSPVARWARELREALKSDASDGRDAQNPSCADADGAADVTSDATKVTRYPAEDVSMSAYDLLPADEREAVAWVREHGGIERLSRLFQDADNRRVELCAALGIDLDKGWSDAMAAMCPRLMPEGCKWPTVDGRKVDFKTPYQPSLGVLEAVSIYNNGAVEVMSHDGIVKPVSEIHVVVLAADGEPLREGEHVYHVETGAELVVKRLPKPGEYQAVVVFALPTSPASHLTSFDPDQLTHQRPDTWQRIEEDLGDEMAKQQCGPISPELACRLAGEFVRRCRALAEREGGE